MNEDGEAEYVRQIPSWVKGWVVARTDKDFRVWPQQKPGYYTLQRREPQHRTYVWPEQDWMPEDEQAAYEARGAHLTLSEVLAAAGATVVPAGPITPERLADLFAEV